MTSIPTRERAFEIMDQRSVPDHIRRHCLMVRRVALVAARALNQQGAGLDLKLVEAGALLHDICKYDSIVSGGDHARMGAELMAGLGYPAVAAIVGQHVRLESFEVTAALVVNYADKRVKHDAVVSLDDRFVDLMLRYGTDEVRQARIRELYEEGLKAQAVVCSAAGIEAGSLNLLSLIPADYPLYGGLSVGRQHGAVEVGDQQV